MVQIRERDLAARDLYYLAKAVTERLRGSGTLVLVNDRADLAASTGAGVHLTTRSLTPEVVRAAFGPDVLIGVSTHNQQEAEAAQRGGADFIVFGPVFETQSKAEYGEPVGTAALHRVAGSSSIPVIALGGINPTNCQETLDAGAAGVAGISMFTKSFTQTVQSQGLNELVSNIRNMKLR
ncbi:MAG TPA: thiamine phosphate synthase [Blastocatellia bacterium]|nr:thiamine phosphate synthase [Blastocatellia bacterium]